LTLLGALTACAAAPKTTPHELRYAIAEDVANLNPHLSGQVSVSVLSSWTAAWLTRVGARGEPVPELATVIPTPANGGISSDGRTIIYHLRRGVVWSDGAPFNADDVVFSTKVVLNPANNEGTRAGWDDIATIQEPDKYTVVYRLRHPYAGFIYQYFSTEGANPSILPKHILGGLPNINDAPYNALPIGIGPFKYVRWKRSDFIELAANPTYFRGPPKLRRIVVRIMPDRNAALNALEAHEVDLLILWPSYYERARAIPGVTVSKRLGGRYAHLDFNLSHPVVADPAVRQAIRLAIDRETILRKIGRGLGIVQDNIVSPINPAFDPRVPTAPFDIAAANRILDGAGWRRGPDGVRERNGRRLELFFAASAGTPDLDERNELIRQWLRRIGVALDIRRYAAPIYFALASQGGILAGGKFDLTTFVSSGDPIGDLSGQYACSAAAPNGQNVTHYCNRRVDAAMDAFSRLYSFRARQPYADFVQSQLQRDVPSIVLSIPYDLFAYNSKLRGFRTGSIAPFDDFMRVDI
jgi:peptide/nickel transport system substrate-binding protein